MIFPVTLLILAWLLRRGLLLWEQSKTWAEERPKTPEVSAAEAIRMTDLALDGMQPLLRLLPDWAGEIWRGKTPEEG